MEIGCFSEFDGDQQVFRVVAGETGDRATEDDDVVLGADAYCQRMLDGRELLQVLARVVARDLSLRATEARRRSDETRAPPPGRDRAGRSSGPRRSTPCSRRSRSGRPMTRRARPLRPNADPATP